jgi:uncharacterized membrane protein YhaH (DUF805 family)
VIIEDPRHQNRAEALLENIMRSAHPMLDWTDYQGRDTRRAFWSFALLTFATMLTGRLMDLLVFGLAPGEPPLFFAGIFGLVLLPPLIAIGARRLHDTGRSGWLMLLACVPVLGWSLLLLWWSQPTKHERHLHSARS